MNCHSNSQLLFNQITAMEIDQNESPKQQDEDEEEEDEESSSDPFLKFVDYAKSALLLSPEGDESEEEEFIRPGWSWIVSRILKTCFAYSSGVTTAILLSDLSQVVLFIYSFISLSFSLCVCLLLFVLLCLFAYRLGLVG